MKKEVCYNKIKKMFRYWLRKRYYLIVLSDQLHIIEKESWEKSSFLLVLLI